MKTTTITLVLALAAIGTGCTTTPERSRNLADPSVSGKTLAQQVCSNCHGIDGNSVNPTFPKLAEQQPEYLEAQLKIFRNHKRSDPPGFEYMWGISRSLTDGQIKELATYFAAQKNIPDKVANAQLAARGKEIFTKGIPAKNIPPCMTCHGPDGAGNSQFPRIAGQHADYVIKQLDVFQRTDERPEGVLMKTIVHDLTQQDLTAAAAYVSTLAAK